MREQLAPETFPPKQSGIRLEAEKYIAFYMEHKASVDEELARNINKALRTQGKIEKALEQGVEPNFFKIVEMMNCRKAVFAVTGAVPLKDLVDTQQVERFKSSELSARDKVELSYQAAGVRELRYDVERILNKGILPILGSGKDMHFTSHLEEHSEDIPTIVHVFEVPPQRTSEVISRLIGQAGPMTADDVLNKLPRVHTFLVLGKDATTGEYLCFQKKGPEVEKGFGITTLKDIEQGTGYFNLPDKLFLSVMGPAPKPNDLASQNNRVRRLRRASGVPDGDGMIHP